MLYCLCINLRKMQPFPSCERFYGELKRGIGRTQERDDEFRGRFKSMGRVLLLW